MIEKIAIAGLSALFSHYATKEQLIQKNHIFSKDIFFKNFNLIKIAANENAMWIIDDNLVTVEQSITEYNYDDIRTTDNILDIGACIGGFALNVNKKVNHVFAIEPIMSDSLRKNVELNCAKNVTIMEYALGNGETTIVQWGKQYKIMNTMSLTDIIKLCNTHIDFIKIDCEGGEWFIKPSDIYDIRRLEIEVHNFNNDKDYNDFKNMLAGFEYTSRINGDTMMISARNKSQDR